MPETMISAHRCGAGTDKASENTMAALQAAITLGVEFVEFDVQRCMDGTFVLYHDDTMLIDGELVAVADLTFAKFSAQAGNYLTYSDALHALAGHAKAHIDFKFTSPAATYADPATTYEVDATREALTVMGEGNLIVTTMEDRSVRAVRDWADSRNLDLLVGLSLGRDTSAMTLADKWRTRASELFPHRRYRRTRANLVVVNHRLARKTVARFATKYGLRMLVWTVDDPAEMAYWIHDRPAWLVTTNFPNKAMRVRNQYR